MSTPASFVELLGLLLVVALGAYLGTYLRTAGQRRAIQESLDRIERRTEEIKAEIADALWLRQKRWDLRREIYSQLLQALDDIYNALVGMIGADQLARRSPPGPERQVFEKSRTDAYGRLVQAHRAASRVRAVGDILLPSDATEMLDALTDEWNPLPFNSQGERPQVGS